MHLPIGFTPHKLEGSTLGLIRPRACQVKVKSRGIGGIIRMTIVEYDYVIVTSFFRARSIKFSRLEHVLRRLN